MSSFAGNELLISPEGLIADGLLQASDAQSHFSADAVDYDSVIPFKQRLLETAWANFKAGERSNTDRRAAISRLPTTSSAPCKRIGWKTTLCSGR